jgi:hypothetical protein
VVFYYELKTLNFVNAGFLNPAKREFFEDI